ncbi:MAG: 3-dehydroquinate synthase [Armatimonadetes bacterium]|nr:3-dehydroquinate synthase [Armatimonadota bacterium]
MIVKHATGEYEIRFQRVELPEGVVITDRNVAEAHPDLLKSREVIVLEPGEQSKSLDVYGQMCRDLIGRKVTRKSTLVALGGGVLGDLVGFVAATYMRGIRYVQIPTTLLAQVDSSVGGKTGIDLPEGKNLVGAFYPPSLVQIDTVLLNTLPERQFRCGMAEVIKYGFIQSPSLTDSLEGNALQPGDFRLQSVVEECIGIKARMVQEDEFETLGIRAQLNFGHTVGHALEQMTNYEKYTHGEAISVGMVVETKIAEKLGMAQNGLTERVANLLFKHGLPVDAVELKEIDQVVSVMRKDKKSLQGELSMSLVREVGDCVLASNVEEGVVREVLGEFGQS